MVAGVARALGVALLLALAAVALAACSSAEDDGPARISASILIEPSPGDARW